MIIHEHEWNPIGTVEQEIIRKNKKQLNFYKKKQDNSWTNLGAFIKFNAYIIWLAILQLKKKE